MTQPSTMNQAPRTSGAAPAYRPPSAVHPLTVIRRYDDERRAAAIRGLKLASSALTIPTLILACVPAWGFLVWLVGGPVIFILAILAVILLAKGATTSGVIRLLLALIFLPILFALAPLISYQVRETLGRIHASR